MNSKADGDTSARFYAALLYPEQVSVCACSCKIEFVAVHPVDEQPVRLYVAFPMSGVLARQTMVFVLTRQRSGYAQGIDGR